MTANTHQPSLRERIRNHLQECSPKERELAEFLLANEQDLAIYSSADMARLAGVSKPVVSRFFKRLGFDSFNDVRELLRSQRLLGTPNVPANLLEGQDAELFQQHLVQESRNWQSTLADLDPVKAQQIAGALTSARKVVLIGYRNSYPVAQHFRQQLLQLRGNVNVLPVPGQTLAEELVELDEQDLIIVVGIRRRPRFLAQLLQSLHRHPARCLLLTDPTGIELSRFANWALVCQILSISAFDSYSGVMGLISLICNLAIHQDVERASARIRQIDDRFEELEELDFTRLQGSD